MTPPPQSGTSPKVQAQASGSESSSSSSSRTETNNNTKQWWGSREFLEQRTLQFPQILLRDVPGKKEYTAEADKAVEEKKKLAPEAGTVINNQNVQENFSEEGGVGGEMSQRKPLFEVSRISGRPLGNGVGTSAHSATTSSQRSVSSLIDEKDPPLPVASEKPGKGIIQIAVAVGVAIGLYLERHALKSFFSYLLVFFRKRKKPKEKSSQRYSVRPPDKTKF